MIFWKVWFDVDKIHNAVAYVVWIKKVIFSHFLLIPQSLFEISLKLRSEVNRLLSLKGQIVNIFVIFCRLYDDLCHICNSDVVNVKATIDNVF